MHPPSLPRPCITTNTLRRWCCSPKVVRSLNFTKRIITNNMVKTEEATKKKRDDEEGEGGAAAGENAHKKKTRWGWRKMGDKVFDKIICGCTQKQRQQLKTARQREGAREKKGGEREEASWIASGKLSHKEKFAQTNLKKIIITRTVSQMFQFGRVRAEERLSPSCTRVAVVWGLRSEGCCTRKYFNCR